MARGIVIASALACAAIAAACAPQGENAIAPRSSAPAPTERAGAIAVDRNPIVDWPPVVMRCLQLGDTCGGSAATCRGLVTLNEEARADAMRCFTTTMTCEAYATCFRAFLASTLVPDIPPRGTRSLEK